MPALANEFRGLISALHLFKYRGVRPFFILSRRTGAFLRPHRTQNYAPGGQPERAGLIKSGLWKVNEGEGERANRE